jgi:hypothetical protein
MRQGPLHERPLDQVVQPLKAQGEAEGGETQQLEASAGDRQGVRWGEGQPGRSVQLDLGFYYKSLRGGGEG